METINKGIISYSYSHKKDALYDFRVSNDEGVVIYQKVVDDKFIKHFLKSIYV